MDRTFSCIHCHTKWEIKGLDQPLFCPSCGKNLEQREFPSNTLIRNRYRILESIGKGGMGEVLLVYDAACERKIALKRIRADLLEHIQVKNRFLKEAYITCQLNHPAIIPIFTIHGNEEAAYYTMPFVEGETLKQIIRKTRKQEKKGETLDHIGGSIPALMRIFITICQAVAYAHSKGVIHRDLKLENIIVGKYGEVLILDWGLAKFLESHTNVDEEEEIKVLTSRGDITRVGRIVGTIAYMAPERAMGHPATIQTDIYSLGVILYQMLTLYPPFKRAKTLTDFKKGIPKEKWVDPAIIAPYRDIPRMLARVAEKSVSKDLKERYQTVDELIRDVENYIEGRSEWFKATELKVNQKEDWEFQENVLIAEHIAVIRTMEETEWVNLMISKSSFSGNIKIETKVLIKEDGNGIGFLFGVPEVTERIHLNDGYCLWLGSDQNRTTKLLRSNVEVVDAPDIFLKRNQWYQITIEKIEQSVHVYIDDTLQLSYIAHMPLIGTHIGLLSKDADYEISPINIYVGSLNIMVNCLAVPDAFLSHRDFSHALSEYRRIAYSFPDRSEGREALFRAGLTFIEQAKTNPNKEKLLDLARQEFEKLHKTPSAPLEYLGKALVYQALNDEEEEIKCFELAYRRYPKHPVLPVLQEQIISRMHDVSRYHRIAAYHFILLAIRHLPLEAIDIHTRRLFTSLQKHWEYLPFIEEDPSSDKNLNQYQFAIQLAFWLAKPYILGEIIDDLTDYLPSSHTVIGNALFALLELGAVNYAKEKLNALTSQHESKWPDIENALNHTFHLPKTNTLTFSQWRTLEYLLNFSIESIHSKVKKLSLYNLTEEQKLALDIKNIGAYLLEKNWDAVAKIFSSYPDELLKKETFPLHFFYGCFLQATEGKEIAQVHFAGLLHSSYPRTWTLASHFISGNLSLSDPWFKKAFLWEKRQLYKQLFLYYYCKGNDEKSKSFLNLYENQFLNV